MTALTADQQERLSLWRNIALQRMPFFAPILFAMQPNHSTQLTTMGVDRAWRLYINFDAPMFKDNALAGEVLLHECGHLWNRHAERADSLGLPFGDKDFNYAGDCEINDDLVAAGCTRIAKTGVLPKHLGEPDFHTAEHYYKAIKNSPKQKPGTGDPVRGVDDPDGEPGEPYDGCGSGAGGQPGPFGSGLDPYAPSAQPGLDENTRDSLLHTSAILAQDAASKGQGTVPAGILAQAEILLTPPQVPWQRVLGPTVRLAAQVRPGGDELTYNRTSRRRGNLAFPSGKRILFPSAVHRCPKIVTVRDTSGSMSDRDLQMVSSEMVGIATSMGIRGDDYLVIDTDATAYEARKYTGAETLETVEGRGGTDMRVGINAALLHKPDVVVILTDGFTPWPDAPPRGRVRLIACIVAATLKAGESVAEDVPDFIKTVVIDTSQA